MKTSWTHRARKTFERLAVWLFPDRSHVFPPGEQLTFLAGADPWRRRQNPEGAPVVSGQVQASQVRNATNRKDFAWWIEVLMTDMTTFQHGDPPEAIETLPPETTSLFRIGVPARHTIDRTRQLLRGELDQPGDRAGVVAYEVPWQWCPDCQSRVSQTHRFCHACGTRLHALYGETLPETRGQRAGPKDEICPNCWLRPDSTNFCKHCGFDLNVRQQLIRWTRDHDQPVKLMLVARQRRMGRVRAHITKLTAEKIDPDLPAQLVAHIQNVETTDELATAWLRPPTSDDFSTRVLLSHQQQDWTDTLERLGRNEVVRATEFKRHCTGCNHRSREERPFATGFFCSECGSRQRLTRHPSWGEHIEPAEGSNLPVHHCGFSYDPALDRFCSMCGESLADFDPEPSRLGGLSEEMRVNR